MNAARAAFVALLLCFSFAAAADVAVPPLAGRVVDQTGTLSGGDIASLTQTLKDLETRKGSQIAVLIVPTTAPETIEQYSLRVAEAWKIGRKKIDDGALLVVAKNDRRLRIEVGYGLEGALNDVTARRIIDEDITPKFKSGDFAGGISAGVDRMIRVIDGEKLPAPESRQGFGLAEQHRSVQPVPDLRRLHRRQHPAQHAGPADGVGRNRRAGRAAGMASGRVAGAVGHLRDHRLRSHHVRRDVSPRRAGGAGPGPGGSSSGRSSGGGFSGGGGSFGGGGASGRW